MAWSDMESKQKGMLIATIIVFVIIGYMVYKLFFAGSSSAPPPAAMAKPAVAVKAAPAATPGGTANTNNNSAGVDLAVSGSTQQPGAANATAANAPPQVVEIPKRELTPEELQLLEERRQVQQQYLQLVNQYQLMEIQNKVATSQSTLLKTQIDTAKSEQQATKLGLVLPGQAGNDEEDKTLSGVSLVYVGQKNGVWNAMLNLRGNYVAVNLGSRLPDGSLVSKIDESGIVLYKDGERRTLAMPTVVNQPSGDDTTDDSSKDQ